MALFDVVTQGLDKTTRTPLADTYEISLSKDIADPGIKQDISYYAKKDVGKIKEKLIKTIIDQQEKQALKQKQTVKKNEGVETSKVFEIEKKNKERNEKAKAELAKLDHDQQALTAPTANPALKETVKKPENIQGPERIEVVQRLGFTDEKQLTDAMKTPNSQFKQYTDAGLDVGQVISLFYTKLHLDKKAGENPSIKTDKAYLQYMQTMSDFETKAKINLHPAPDAIRLGLPVKVEQMRDLPDQQIKELPKAFTGKTLDNLEPNDKRKTETDPTKLQIEANWNADKRGCSRIFFLIRI